VRLDGVLKKTTKGALLGKGKGDLARFDKFGGVVPGTKKKRSGSD